MAKKPITKISDKLERVNDSFSITTYDNGFLIEVSGRDKDDEYRTAKILVPSVEQLIELVKEATSMERED